MYVLALSAVLGTGELLRLYAPHRTQRGLSPQLRAYSAAFYDERDEAHTHPTPIAVGMELTDLSSPSPRYL